MTCVACPRIATEDDAWTVLVLVAEGARPVEVGLCPTCQRTTRWVGKNIKGPWPADRTQSAQDLAAALFSCAKHGIEPDDLMRLCEDQWQRTRWSEAAAQQLIAEIQSLDAGEPPPDDAEAVLAETPDDLPETLPW